MSSISEFMYDIYAYIEIYICIYFFQARDKIVDAFLKNRDSEYKT